MTEPRDDETRPLPADRTERLPPTRGEPPTPVGDLPGWTRSSDAAGHQPGPVPVAVTPGSVSLPDSVPSATRPTRDPSARTRWSGRRTAVVVATALALGALGALGATAAVAQSDGRGADVGGPGGRPGQSPSGPGRFPGGGQGQLPGGPRPGGFDRDGDHRGSADRDGLGDHDGGRDGANPGTGIPGAPGTDGGGSADPGDASGGAMLST